jgi:hypothetical protein
VTNPPRNNTMPNLDEQDIVKKINESIRSYGSDNERPLFQVVWSDNEREWRHGTFAKYYKQMYLGEEVCTKFVPKYNYIQSRWIIEKFNSPNSNFDEELPLAHQGTYEPIYVFEADGKPLPPRLDVCEIVIHTILYPWEKAKQHAAIEDMILKAEAKDLKEMRELLDGDDSDLQYRLHSGGAVLNAQETKK